MKIRSIAVFLVAVLLVGILAGCDLDAAVAAAVGTLRPGGQTNGQTALLAREEAENIALSHAGLAVQTVRMERTELDADDRIPHYEVEFAADGWEYDYEVHAQTGEVLKAEKEQKDKTAAEPSVPPTTAPAFGRELAEAIALKHAGLTARQARMERTELDADDHIPHYEVEFAADGWEYDYEIHAQNGTVLKAEKEPVD